MSSKEKQKNGRVLGTKKVLNILEGVKLIIENIELFLSLQMFFSVIRPFVLINCYLSNLGSFPTTETGKLGYYILQCLHFKEAVPGL